MKRDLEAFPGSHLRLPPAGGSLFEGMLLSRYLRGCMCYTTTGSQVNASPESPFPRP